MEGICKRLNPACILLDLESRDKQTIIEHMVRALHNTYTLPNPEILVQEIMARENLASTCLGAGCAVPHAHSAGLKTSYLAATRLTEPLDVETPDGEPITLIFLLVGPPHNAATHLKLLSKLARLLHDSQFRDELRRATSVEEFHTKVCDKED
jgi:mannitol/fructose-specific phosphotransferase system IIA component (Ntr-type)